MQTAALIVAAGMSKRMGEFKPMLSIGSISIAQRVIATLQQSGVSKIVMVTGYNATALERHLSGNGVIFLRNDRYETTQMFDSVRIGLRYLKGKCDRVLFTPVDVPLFTAHTVRAILDSGASLACPMCEGKQGHPILIAESLIQEILLDCGEQGLKGAMDRCSEPLVRIDVEDPGTIRDADTPEDYASLVDYHNSQLVRPVVNVALAREMPFFDSRVAVLLTLIDETSSVRTACQRMQISYSSGWNLIRTLESQLKFSLILRSQGGIGGGMSILSEDGRKLLQLFNDYQNELRTQADILFENISKGFSDAKNLSDPPCPSGHASGKKAVHRLHRRSPWNPWPASVCSAGGIHENQTGFGGVLQRSEPCHGNGPCHFSRPHHCS